MSALRSGDPMREFSLGWNAAVAQMKAAGRYDPLAAFDSFSREELREALLMWIKRCDKAEADRAELLSAAQQFIDALENNRGMMDCELTARAAIAKAVGA